MKIVKLVLKGYKRLFLSHIKKLEFTPEVKVNLVLGQNGSGKSSLLFELSPLPADLKKEYEEDGYKDITIEHNNQNYRLTSGIAGNNKHSFLLDNEELNPAGTKKVQLILVKEHFNITPEVHNVMLGLKGLTTMSIMERKNWLTNISTSDYTYALAVYNRIKARNRDIVGAIKVSQSELSKNNSVVLTIDEVKDINDEISIIKDINKLLLNSKEITKDNKELINITELINNTNNILDKIKIPNDINVNDIRTVIYGLNSRIESNVDRILELETSLKELSFLDSFKDDTKLTNVEAISNIKNQLDKLKNSLYLDIDLNNIVKIKDMFSFITPKLLDILNVIVLHTVDEYGMDEYREDVNKIKNIIFNIDRKTKLINTLNKDKESMEHNRDHNSVECPKCSNIWSIGFIEKDYKYLLSKILENENSSIRDIKSKDELLERIEFYNVKLKAISDIKNMFSDNTLIDIKEMFNYVSKIDINNSPNQAIDAVNKLNIDLEGYGKYIDYMSEYDELLKEEKILEERKKVELKYFNSNKDKLETELFNLKDIKRISLNKIDELTKYDKINNVLRGNSEKLITFLRNVNSNVKNSIKVKKNESINESINILSVEISKLEHKLRESEYNSRLIEDSQRQIKELVEKKEATGILLKAMSPSNGLIGKSITNFLNMFTNDMNEIINSIWNYNMEILPCKITDTNDLDYKFEVRVDNRNIIEDVSKTSSSMQEIIDLAFKIVSMKYLGMDDSYLLLDEFGRTFDAVHSNNAYDIIDVLSNSSFSQVFLISHFENTYSRFKNADVSVINEDSLMLNKDVTVNRVLKLS